MISARDTGKVFHAGRPSEFAPLQGVSLDLDWRETTVLNGPSGSGKTPCCSARR